MPISLGLRADALPEEPKESEGFYSIPLSTASQSAGFTLMDLDGEQLTPSSFPGSVFVLFFGFLSCPSICPTTMMELVSARRMLGDDAQRVRIAFATLDPERDSAAAMRQWLGYFGDDLVGLRDSPEAILEATQALRLPWQRVPGTDSDPDYYMIDHGVQSYTYDPQGRLRLLVRPGPTPQQIAADWRSLLNGA